MAIPRPVSSRFSSLFLAVLLVACSNRYAGSRAISHRITEQLNTDSTLPLNLSQMVTDPWDRVCILGPYTTNTAAESILGFPWNVEKNSSISQNDGINLLVFIDHLDVVTWVEHPRNQGDFSSLASQCFDRNQAALLPQTSADGWITFVVP